MTTRIRKRGFEVTALDVFCGFGGSSQGIHRSGATVVGAANHNPLAIDCHAANFPDTEHFRADLVDPDSGDYMDPIELPAARFAWFSPGCTHHSPANAQKMYEQGRQLTMFDDGEPVDEAAYANSERSRVTMSCVLRYCSAHTPEIIVVENVVEVCHWGPGRDGSTYRWWLNELSKLGYDIEECFFNSMFFPPTPQSRDRIYIVAWRKGNRRPDLSHRPTAYCMSYRCGGKVTTAYQAWKQTRPSWPRPRWGKFRHQYVYRCSECNDEVMPLAWPAYTAIDWSNLGPAIGERADLGMAPLAANTMDRIRRGLVKFRGSPPIIIPTKSVWGSDKPVYEPFTAQTTQQDKALVTSVLIASNGGADGYTRARSVHEPAQTVVGGGRPVQLASAGLLPIRSGRPRSNAAHDQIPTIVGNGSHMALATEGFVLPAAGNTFERPGQTRGKPLHDPLFTQHATRAFGFAHSPFVIEMRGGGSVKAGQHSVEQVLHSVTAGGFHHGLTSPGMFQKINGGPTDTTWHHTGEPLNTVTGRDTHGMIVLPWVDQWRSDPASIEAQMATVMSHLRHALASIEVDELAEVSLEELAAVRFRMLEPHPELRRAMAFGDDYVLLGNKTQMTSGLGNAVTPPVAEWLTMRCLATLGDGATNERAA